MKANTKLLSMSTGAVFLMAFLLAATVGMSGSDDSAAVEDVSRVTIDFGDPAIDQAITDASAQLDPSQIPADWEAQLQALADQYGVPIDISGDLEAQLQALADQYGVTIEVVTALLASYGVNVTDIETRGEQAVLDATVGWHILPSGYIFDVDSTTGEVYLHIGTTSKLDIIDPDGTKVLTIQGYKDGDLKFNFDGVGVIWVRDLTEPGLVINGQVVY